MAADGSIIIDTKVDTQGFANLGKSVSGLPSVLKRIGSAIGAAFAVGKLTAFAKEAIQLGSDLAEVQNVVDVTFKTLNENINNFAENAIFVSGLSETMAKKYAGTFGAMANSFGFTEQEAYTLATTLTTLSGDIASFYNITQDEAFTKLKSVFTGETEALKELGVVMTQTALDAYAMEKGIGRTVSQMTEQEKVALRYRFVMDQLSDASGDFARTSGSWANQTRILSVQFDQLKATIGQGLINALTPVIQVINTILAGIQTVANAFKQFTSLLFGNAAEVTSGGVSAENLQEVADGYNSAAGGAQDLADGTKAAAKEAKKALAPFDELTKLSEETSSGGGGGGGGIGGGVLGNLGAVTVDAQVQDQISPKIQSIVDKVKSLIEPLKNINFEPLRNSFQVLWESLVNLGGIGLDALEWAWFEILVPLSQWTIEEAGPAALAALAEGFKAVKSFLTPVWNGLKKIWDSLTPLFAWIGDNAIVVIDQFGEAFSMISDVFEEKGEKIEGIFIAISDVVSAVWHTIEPYLIAARTMWAEVVNDIVEITAILTGHVIEVLYGLTEWLAGVFTGDWERVWGALTNILSSAWDTCVELLNWMYQGFGDYLNDIVDSIIAFVNDAIGFLSGLFDFTPNTTTQSTSSGITAYSVRPEVPYLAKGAVLPANKPFLAMVGDQTHGTNVEAPLDTIKQALAEVLAQTGSGGIEISFTGDLAALGRVLAPVVTRAQRNNERGGGR